MRKYGKWVLTLSLLAATPGLSFAADPMTGARGVRSSKVDNQRVAENIASALKGKVSGEITIEYKDGVAVLNGSVSDPKVRKLAEELTGKVADVNRVENRIRVVDKKTAKRGKTSDVTQAAHSGERSARGTIQQVNNSVDATGANLPAAAAPEYAAMQNPAGSNQEMAERIGAVLTEARLDGYEIEVGYMNGVAILSGSVGTQAERAAAHRAAGSVPGVRHVQNRLACTQEVAAGPQGYPGARNPYAPYGNPQYGNIRDVGYMQPPAGGPQPVPDPAYAGPPPQAGMPMAPGGPAYGGPAGPGGAVYNCPNMPDYAWPTYAQYPNSAAVTYPQQYSASAWPYIGPFYPYPQVPLGWRDATLRWDDGQWNLMFRPRTDRWWWFLNPNNW